MTLLEKITDEWKAAMKSGDKERRETLSILRAGVKDAEINARGSENNIDPQSDEAVRRVIEREAKKRRDAMEEYQKANRPDRVEAEAAELKILQEFLPAQLEETEIETLAATAIAQTGASGPKDMGAVMSALKSQTQGRADGKQVSTIVRKLLS